MNRKETQIFLLSFLILFLELSLIRFLPAQIAGLGYYTNFILLASFIGISAGILMAGKEWELKWYFPWMLLLLIYLSTRLTFSILPNPVGEIHFLFVPLPGKQLPEIVLIPVLFCIIALTFSFLSQTLGKLFNGLPPLLAYKWDIGGGIFGVLTFTLCSYYQFNPVAWFIIIGLLFLILNYEKTNICFLSIIALIGTLYLVDLSTRETYWSPYQKITVNPWIEPSSNEVQGYEIFVNNIFHQVVVKDISKREFFYKIPYEFFNNNSYKNALIIGAGTGNDVALALANNVEHIDAVEIDPVIKSFGDKLNPYKPYEDPRVSVHVTDARSFLQKSKKRYDIIIFALTDSLILASNHSNIRLESFLYTLDSFRSAKDHLTDNGLVVLYNNYREPWLVHKLSKMLAIVFNKETFVLNTQWSSAILMNGPKLNDLRTDVPRVKTPFIDLKLATDDWPFPYLYEPSIPTIYIKIFIILALIIYFSFNWILSEPLYEKINFTYFFLGLAFLLLETKSIVLFSLYFGSTWVVNSLVFLAILILVYFAIILVEKMKTNNLNLWYSLLGISLLVQYFSSSQLILELPLFIKYVVVSLVALLPIFFANVIFSLTFKESKFNSINFASNILGAGVGGFAEYLSLMLGYKNLILFIALSYFLARKNLRT